jgi:tetratricopeptide (TPR) repeat protein
MPTLKPDPKPDHPTVRPEPVEGQRDQPVRPEPVEGHRPPLTFTIETFDDPESGQPTQYGHFSRNWEDEEALDALIDQLEAGRVTHKQALMQARKLEATTPDNLEIQNFMANRLWALGLQDEAAEVYERAFRRAQAHIPKGYTGQITWSEMNNRSFLRLAHGTLLGLMRKRDGKAATALSQQMLAWCPMDNIGVRFLLADIALLKGDHHAALQEYLKGAPNSPAHWYQAALIAFRQGDFVAACTYLRRGIAANPYMAEGLTGRTVLSEHLYWHASNVNAPEWAIDYLESAACDWTTEEIDFVDWVFNAAPVLKERAEWMALNERLTYAWDAEERAPYAQKSMAFISRITDTPSKKMVRKVKNRWGNDIWPWDREGFQRPLALPQRIERQR